MPCKECSRPADCQTVCQIYRRDLLQQCAASGQMDASQVHKHAAAGELAARRCWEHPGYDAADCPRCPASAAGTHAASILEQAMRLHDEAAEARRLFGKEHGFVPHAEADRSRRTRAALRAFLSQHLNHRENTR